MQDKSNIVQFEDEQLNDVVGGLNNERAEANGGDTVCAGCGISLGRKAYKYQGKSYCSRCFMQLKSKS